MVKREDAGFEDGERPGLPVEPIFAAGLWLVALTDPYVSPTPSLARLAESDGVGDAVSDEGDADGRA